MSKNNGKYGKLYICLDAVFISNGKMIILDGRTNEPITALAGEEIFLHDSDASSGVTGTQNETSNQLLAITESNIRDTIHSGKYISHIL